VDLIATTPQTLNFMQAFETKLQDEGQHNCDLIALPCYYGPVCSACDQPLI
jgi:hypothetical protein